AENILRPFIQPLVEQRAKAALVQLAREEVQPGLKLRPLDGSIRWRKLSPGIAVSDVLGDRGGLEQHAAVIERQSRHVAQRVYGAVVAAIGHLLAGFIDPYSDKGQTALEQGDIGHERYRARRIVELHAPSALGDFGRVA